MPHIYKKRIDVKRSYGTPKYAQKRNVKRHTPFEVWRINKRSRALDKKIQDILSSITSIEYVFRSPADRRANIALQNRAFARYLRRAGKDNFIAVRSNKLAMQALNLYYRIRDSEPPPQRYYAVTPRYPNVQAYRRASSYGVIGTPKNRQLIRESVK